MAFHEATAATTGAAPVGRPQRDASAVTLAWVATSADATKRRHIGKGQTVKTIEGKEVVTWEVTSGVSGPFICEAVTYAGDLPSIAEDCRKRIASGHWSLVMGRLAPGLDPAGRHPRNGETFVDAALRVLIFDADGLAPDKDGPRLDTAEAFERAESPITATVRARVPEAMKGVDMLRIATTSTGLPFDTKGRPANGRAWTRLLFLADRPVTIAQMKALAAAMKLRPGLECLDLSIYAPEHFVFLARPRFLDGTADPITRPVRGAPGEARVVDVGALARELGVGLDKVPPRDAVPAARKSKGDNASRLLDVDPLRRVELVRRIVATLPNAVHEYDPWIHVAHGLWGATGGAPEAREIWLEWCGRYQGEVKPPKDADTWDGLDPNGRAGFGELARLALAAGTEEARNALAEAREAQLDWRTKEAVRTAPKRQEEARSAFPVVTEAELAEAAALVARLPHGPRWLRDMNKRFAFVVDRPGGVLDLGGGSAVGRMLSLPEFHNIHANKLVSFDVGEEGKRREKRVSKSRLWFASPQRREFTTAGDYTLGAEPPGALNLWKGLAIEPEAGTWPTIKAFLHDVIAASDARDYAYLRDLLFWKVQNPTENPEVAIALQSAPGAGKGTFGHMLKTIFGADRFLQVTRPDDVVGRFNGDAEGRAVVFYDEVHFGHDPRLRAALKAAITEPTIPIERKGVDRYQVRNMALRVYASNETAALPIDLNDRRVFALALSEDHAKDAAYFRALRAAMDGDELRAFVHDALAADLTAFEATRREPPKTRARAKLAAAVAKPEDEFIYETLTRGAPPHAGAHWGPSRYPRATPEPPDPWRSGRVTIHRDALPEAYGDWLKRRHPRAVPVNAAELLARLGAVLGTACFRSIQVKAPGSGGQREYLPALASLQDCRDAYDKHVGSPSEWP